MLGGLAFDVVIIGHCTKDTIVYRDRQVVQHGGSYSYAAHVAARMGLRTAIVTHMAQCDLPALTSLQDLGVRCYVGQASRSTCVRLIYPSSDPDHRIIEVEAQAEAFSIEDVAGLEARAYHVTPCLPGEVLEEVVCALAARPGLLCLDVQGYTRVIEGGKVQQDRWADCRDMLQHVYVLKVDAAEAAAMTQLSDPRKAILELGKLGPREVVLTHCGGVLVWADGPVFETPFVNEGMAARTGRGDTCIAAYLGRRLTGEPPQTAAVWATAVTSLKLEEPGPFRREIGEVEAPVKRQRAGLGLAAWPG